MLGSANHMNMIVGRRRLIAFGLMCGAGLRVTDAFAEYKRPLKILFICQYGTAKSAIAREVFRQHARRRGIDVRAFSRGLTLENHISPDLLRKLLADQIDTRADVPKRLRKSDWAGADIVVAFNALPVTVKRSGIRDWSDLPSVNEDYAKARAILDVRINALLDEIRARTGHPQK